MSYQTLHTIVISVLWLFGLLGLSGLCLVIFLFGRNSISDNSDKAYIFTVKGGRLQKPIKADIVLDEQKGYLYRHGKKYSGLPKKYDVVYYRGRRVFFKDEHGFIALPFNNDTALADDERNSLLYDYIEAHVGTEILKAVKGKVNKNFAIIGFIIAFGLGCIVTYGFVSFQNAKPTTTQQAQPTQTQQPDYKIQQGK